MRLAHHHITTPKLDVTAFFALARQWGVTDVKVRNDIADHGVTLRPQAVIHQSMNFIKGQL